MAVLLLEHVEWRLVVAAWARLAPAWIGLVIQRNEAEASVLSAHRVLTPSMSRFRAEAHPQLIPEDDLTAALASRGYAVHWRVEEAVPDAKFMIALLYHSKASEQPLPNQAHAPAGARP